MKYPRLISSLWVLVALQSARPAEPALQQISPSQRFTFVVLGDNRGDDTGEQPPSFFQVLKAVQAEAPALILDSGDMIYGRTFDSTRVRQQWRIYHQAIAGLRAALFHVPGNHDIWDESSGRIYRELWGKTYFAVDYGNSRFIGLDTESAGGQLGQQQVQWLEQQVETCPQRNLFFFMHRPLFPVDGGIGSSLDAYPAERDRVHNLFVRNREKVQGVFAGHEHIYNFQVRDGVPYYTSGGAGAPLYAPPELGGFHHFLLVHVDDNKVKVELKKVSAETRPLEKPKSVAPKQLLENWGSGLLWFAWDRTASVELTSEQASQGQRALRLNFDLEQYAWPVLVVAPVSPWDVNNWDSFSMDVYVPESLGAGVVVTPALQGATKHATHSTELKPGWNTVTASIPVASLSHREAGQINSLEWSLSTTGKRARKFVVFDNFQLRRRDSLNGGSAELLDGFERPLLWRVFDESVRAQTLTTNNPGSPHGLLVNLDFLACNRPAIFARLNPPWDLTKVKALLLDLKVAKGLPEDLSIILSLRANEVEYASRPVALRSGSNHVSFDLSGNWLPIEVRAAGEQVEFRLLSSNRTRAGSVVFEQLRAAGDS